MKIGDLLLLKGYINKKQLKKALSKQAENAINYDKSQPLGRVLVDEGFVTPQDVQEALNDQNVYEEDKTEKVVMAKPVEIGEGSKFTFDLKFIITMGSVLVSACATYFTITGQIDELSSKNSPSRLEYNHIVDEVDELKNAGNLDIITYKLEQYDETFEELNELEKKLSPLASDLTYMKSELEKLKNKKIDLPEPFDATELTSDIYNLSIKINEIETLIKEYDEKIKKLAKGRF